MRVTNKMMTNNVLYNINGNKQALSKLENQYSTGLKIQKPSDDPIIAVRALKLRTNITELNQYYEKNIPDALAWMDQTEGALNVINEILTQMHTYSTQGATDTLTEDDRNAILENLKQCKDQIFQEGNTNYAGRYVFSGYKTDSSLVFAENTTNYNYKITEPLAGSNIDIIKKSSASIKVSDYDSTNPSGVDLTGSQPYEFSAYRIRLAYNDIKSDAIGIDGNPNVQIKYPQLDVNGDPVKDGAGNIVYDQFDSTKIVYKNSTDAGAYELKSAPDPDADKIVVIADTGELILGDNVYDAFKDKKDIVISYEKESFEKNDLKPEHYFDCVATDMKNTDPSYVPITYTAKEQNIDYEINFNQSITVNTQGRDAITHDIGRTVDDIINSINDVMLVDNKMKEIKKLLSNTENTDEQNAKLNEMLVIAEKEHILKTEVMQTTFEKALTAFSVEQDRVNVAVADLGSRYVRVELTESRLSTEQANYEELLSKNEDADVVDTIIKLKSQETLYNASLNAAAKVVKNSLLDFI